MDLIELAKEIGLDPKRTSSRDGGEYHCACPNPNCDADDNGFAIWPNSEADKCVGHYWCRKCGVKGDAIQFCRDYLGLEWKDACARLNVAAGEFQSVYANIVKKPQKTAKVAKEPSVLWQQKAAFFVDLCHDKLLKTPKALEMLYARGFNNETIKRFKLGYNPIDLWEQYPEWGLEPEVKPDGKLRKLWLAQGWVIPWIDSKGNILKIKTRYEKYESELEKYERDVAAQGKPNWKPQKYIIVKGGISCPATYGNQSLKVGILVESEFDGMLIQQFADDLCFTVATGGSTQPIDLATDHLLRQAHLILLCPDDDDGGDFLLTLQDDYRNMNLWPAPIGKSPGDALKDHGVNLYKWIMQGIPPALIKTSV